MTNCHRLSGWLSYARKERAVVSEIIAVTVGTEFADLASPRVCGLEEAAVLMTVFTMSDYRFRRMLIDDLPMVQRWVETPAVRQWWVDANGHPSSIDKHDLSNTNVAMWIVSYRGAAFAFIQDYDPHAWAGHHFSHLPPGARGIDQFIGVPDMIGRGHGSAFIRSHVDLLFSRGVPSVGTDPHPTNTRAIHSYEKAGFVPFRESMTEWGNCLLMERHANDGP
ncbi:aminoglycoside 6'-N-acetyltransferase (plasmid) [Shinella sp. WSC3-e]|nr:putative Aminoglycoside 6'-N-acetyltransferase [Rhizobiaceae bacterium]CAK7260839.1 aminoglycoside 6'-N-acetyltransferase [Shinella sp. WSC3-e]